ncbi:MAG TPA: copper-containing nitrite reductase [Verrucomicrobiae bacterium]|nr:copper-containing nitrite reductase [Verrucomicrobiae bacterium]
MTIVKNIGMAAVLLAFAAADPVTARDQPLPEITGQENAVLAEAPNVPPTIMRKHATKVVIHLEVKEITKRLADGVQYTFWTFGGNVPGSFIRIREGDLVEFHLHNNQNNKMPHNIDLHAVSGPGGGAGASFTAPGHSSQFSFRALNPGLYVYHCATAPVGMHIANGMYGLILVEPKEGLPPVDREFYVMQGEFYTAGKFGDGGLQSFDMDKAVDERPPYVVFNGAVGALAGSNALTAEVGEKIRIFVGNGGPNLDSSFHVIGNIFDTVYEDGGTTPMHNVQTVLIPAGGSAIVEFQPKVPGAYSFVDHSIFRAFNKGAMGTLNVTGEANPLVFTGKQSDTLFAGSAITNILATTPSGLIAPTTPAKSDPVAPGSPSQQQMDNGRAVFNQICYVCHQSNGLGVPNQIPPLAGSDFLKNSAVDAIHTVIQGRTGQIVVNGQTYNATMVPQGYLSDQQISDVLTFVRNNWGNKGEVITASQVHAARQDPIANSAVPKQSSFE